MHLLLGLDSTERFTILLGFITAVLTLLTVLGGVVWKSVRAAWALAEATRANTRAVKDLHNRLDRMEDALTARGPEVSQARYPRGQVTLEEVQ